MFAGQQKSRVIASIVLTLGLGPALARADSLPEHDSGQDRLRAIQRVSSDNTQEVLNGLRDLGEQSDVPPEVLAQRDHPDPAVRTAVFRFSASRGIYGPLFDALDDSATVLGALEEIRERRLVEAAGSLRNLVADPRRDSALRVTTMEVLSSVSPTTMVHYLDDLGPATDLSPSVRKSQIYWIGRLANEIQVLRASRSYLGHVVAENGPSTHMLLHPDVRYEHDPYIAQDGQVRMRSFRVRNIEHLAGTRYGVDVRVVTEEPGVGGLQLRLDYLVIDIDRGDALVRRVVRGEPLPFG